MPSAISVRHRLWRDGCPCDIADSEIDAIIARGSDDGDGKYAAALILRKMLDAGISRWHPDPLAAFEAASKPR
jgi:hypothetical protein